MCSSNSGLKRKITNLAVVVYGPADSRNFDNNITGLCSGDYQLVFTKSATDALKIIGETFPWREGGEFRYLRENHNSVLGMRQYAIEHGGRFNAVSEDDVETWIKQT